MIHKYFILRLNQPKFEEVEFFTWFSKLSLKILIVKQNNSTDIDNRIFFRLVRSTSHNRRSVSRSRRVQDNRFDSHAQWMNKIMMLRFFPCLIFEKFYQLASNARCIKKNYFSVSRDAFCLPFNAFYFSLYFSEINIFCLSTWK